MKIYLIRHGETTGDVEDRYGGDYDDHLTEKGREQAEKLANKLKDRGIEIFFHSPRFRATETAKILHSKLNIKTRSVNDMRERNGYGILTGMTKAEAKQKFPAEVEKLESDPIYHDDVKDVEQYNDFKERVANAFKEIIENKNYKTIAIISHGGPIKCIVREILKLGELKKHDDCSIIKVEKEKNNLKLKNIDGVELENESK